MTYTTNNNSIHRGEIYYIKDDPNKPAVGSELWSNRLGVIVSCEPNNKHSNVVMVVYLTTAQKAKKLPTYVEIQSSGKKAIALCEAVYSVDISRLEKTNNMSVTEKELQTITDAIALGLNIVKSDKPIGIFKKWENYIKKYDLMPTEPMVETSNELEILKQERDAYKNLYEALTKKMEQVQRLIK